MLCKKNNLSLLEPLEIQIDIFCRKYSLFTNQRKNVKNNYFEPDNSNIIQQPKTTCPRNFVFLIFIYILRLMLLCQILFDQSYPQHFCRKKFQLAKINLFLLPNLFLFLYTALKNLIYITTKLLYSFALKVIFVSSCLAVSHIPQLKQGIKKKFFHQFSKLNQVFILT